MPASPLSSKNQDALKQAAAKQALEFVRDRDVVGLGTGSTIRFFIEALAQRVREGLQIQCVPTSRGTASLATQVGIPLLQDEEEWNIRIAIDGADQVDAQFNLIKGGGGALLREKIVARAAREFIVIVDEGKRVPTLGPGFPVPVEVLPFGWPATAHELTRFGSEVSLRHLNGKPYRTDNDHYILDLHIPSIADPQALETQLNAIPGVIENGLFTGMTSRLLVGTAERVEVVSPPS